VYKIDGNIYEQHGEYQCYLEVWSVEGGTSERVFNLYEIGLKASAPASSEHETILNVVLSALSRTAEKHDRPLY